MKTLLKFKHQFFLFNLITIMIIYTSCGLEEEVLSYSTIDDTLQEHVRDLLEKEIYNRNCDWGCVIIMETKTGKIKSLVNLYHDTINKGVFYDNYDYASTKLIYPGHLFALPSIMACVEDDYINIDDIVTRHKELLFFNYIISDNIDIKMKKISILDAFYKKSNTVIAKIVSDNYQNKPEEFIKKLKQFELNKPLGIDWKNEPTPIIYAPESIEWTDLSLPMLSIGNGSKHTPLQILSFYNSILNNGERIKPVIEKSDTVNLPIVLNKNLYTQSSLSSAKRLLGKRTEESNQLNSNYGKLTGHTAIIKQDYNIDLDNFYTYQMISLEFSPDQNQKYCAISVINIHSLSLLVFDLDILGYVWEFIEKNRKNDEIY